MFNYPYKIIFIAGLPKSGTTWVENFISRVPGYTPRTLTGDRGYINNHGIPMDGFQNFPENEYSCIKTHAEPTSKNLEALKANGVEKVIVQYRDPRDVAISRYHHILKNPKQPHEINYADYSNMSFDDGLSHSIEVIKEEYIPWIQNWINIIKEEPSKYCIIKYEDLYDNPVDSFIKVSNFYKLNLTPEQIKTILEDLEFMKNKFNISSKAGQKSTFRKGGYNNWKSVFSQTHLDSFSEKKALLEEIGYNG